MGLAQLGWTWLNWSSLICLSRLTAFLLANNVLVTVPFNLQLHTSTPLIPQKKKKRRRREIQCKTETTSQDFFFFNLKNDIVELQVV